MNISNSTIMKTLSAGIIGICLLGTTVPCAFGANDPIAHWSFDDTWDDVSGNNHQLDVNGTPAFVAGKVGKGVTFDGIDDWIKVVDPTPFLFDNSSFTVALWCTIRDNADVSMSQFVIHDANARNYHEEEFFTIGKARAGDTTFGQGGEVHTILSNFDNRRDAFSLLSGADFPKNTWTLLVTVVDADANEMRFYIDNVLQGTASLVGLDYDLSSAISPIVTIGAWSNAFYGVISSYHRGEMDEVKVWDRALSEEEVSLLFKGFGVSSPNGGEELIAGQTETISWDSVGDTSNVSIDYSSNNGNTWENIDPNTPNDGEYDWTIPQATSNQCIIRVSDSTDPNVYDVSDDAFTIYVCQNPPLGDLNEDCYINLTDVAILAMNWLWCGNPFDPVCTIDNGLVAYWSFDEGSGDTVYDLSGTNTHGTLHGAIWDPNSISGYGLSLDGIDDYVSFENSSSLKITLPVTITAWAKQKDGECGALFENEFVENSYTGVWFGLCYDIVYAGYGDGGLTQPQDRRSIASSDSYPPNQWYHIAAVISGPLDMALYIDGELIDSYYDGSGGTLYYAGIGDAVVGPSDSSNFSPPDYFGGSVDELRLYNRELTTSEIKYLYQSP